MKILIVTDKMGVGGAQTHIIELANELCELGHFVTVAASERGDGLFSDRVLYKELPLAKKSPKALFFAYLGLKRLTEEKNFDIIHSHARLPSLLCKRLAKRRGICFVCTVHAKFSTSPLKRKFSCWGERSIAVSQDLKQYLIDEYSVLPQSITVIKNGIDTKRFSPCSEKSERLHPIRREHLRIAFLSRLDFDCSRTAELLCEAAEELSEKIGHFEILIGGGGSEFSRIRTLAKQTNRRLGFPCIRLLGNLRDVPSFLRSADIFVGVSRAALEAALCGLFVVICGSEGFFGRLGTDTLQSARESNFCARGCPAPTKEALCGELERAVLMESSARQEEALRLRKLLAAEFNSRAMAEQTEAFYRDAKANRPDKGSGVLLCGYYGFGNMGDDVLLNSALRRAREEYPNVPVCALTRRGRGDGERLGVRCVCRKNPWSIIREIRTSRALVFGGGTVLQARTSRRSLMYYFVLLRIARFFGVPCRLWGNGLGELRSGFERLVMKKALECCEYIGLRDDVSAQRAERILGGNGNIVRERDLACAAKSAEGERVEYLLRLLFGGDVKSFFAIIVNGRNESDAELMRRKIEQIRGRGAELVFAILYEREDGELSEALCREYNGRLLRGICFSELVGVLQRSRGVISMRFHGLVAASMAKVPFEGVGSDEKIKAFKVEN